MGEFDTLSINEPYPHVDQKVQSIFVHPGYDHDGTTTKGYDIALIKLADPVDYAINQIPICLPQNNDTLVGEIAWVKGFGRLSDGNYFQEALTWTQRVLYVGAQYANLEIFSKKERLFI